MRFAWSLKHRSAGWNGLGWSMLALAVLLAALAAGAWGMAIAGLAATASALALLADAAMRSPPGRAEAPSGHAVTTTHATSVPCGHSRPELGGDAAAPGLGGR